MTRAVNDIVERLKGQQVQWLRASKEASVKSSTAAPTILALDRAELLWGETSLTKQFRRLLTERGVSLYNRFIEHHFTGSAIVIDPKTRRVLLTFHSYYKIWAQLGGHDEGENDPLAISAREAWEESGIDDLWICDWLVRVDPHTAFLCAS